MEIKQRKFKLIGQSFLLLCRTIHGIYFLKITPFKCWPQLRFNSSNHKTPILNDSLEDFGRYLANSFSNVGFQCLNSSWFIHKTFRLYIPPQIKVQRCDITRSWRPIHRSETRDKLLTETTTQ